VLVVAFLGGGPNLTTPVVSVMVRPTSTFVLHLWVFVGDFLELFVGEVLDLVFVPGSLVALREADASMDFSDPEESLTTASAPPTFLACSESNMW